MACSLLDLNSFFFSIIKRFNPFANGTCLTAVLVQQFDIEFTKLSMDENVNGKLG